MVSINEPRHEKTCLCHIRTTKARISLRSLISAFIVRCLDSIIPLFAISKISRLQLASVAEQAGLKFWAGGKINRPGQLAPHPLSIRNPTEPLK